MTRSGLRAWLYSLVVVTGPFAALGFGDPSPAVVALPAAVLLTYGYLSGPRSAARAWVGLRTRRTLERLSVEAVLVVEGEGRAAHVSLDLDPALEVEETGAARRAGRAGLVVPMSMGRGEVRLSVVARRWGAYRPSSGRVTIRGPAGIVTVSAPLEASDELVVLPDMETARRLVEPLATNLHAGDIPSRARGPGSDVAELRPFGSGDTPRAINWRASLRSDRLWVTERHADRNGDLILLLDSLVAPGSTMEEAVARAVRITASLVRSYGLARHRLGLVSLGGLVRWFGLDTGTLHEHRLLAAAMATQSVAEPVWVAVDRVLDRVVRPPSMLVVVSPLLDDGLIGRAGRLGAARIDVVVIAVDVSGWLPPPRDEIQALARRLWKMERRRTIDRLRAVGVAVGEWRDGRPLDEILEEVEEWRRLARRVRA